MRIEVITLLFGTCASIIPARKAKVMKAIEQWISKRSDAGNKYVIVILAAGERDGAAMQI